MAGNGQDLLAPEWTQTCQTTGLKQVITAFENKTRVTRWPTQNPRGSQFIQSLHFLSRKGRFQWSKQ